MPKEFYTKEEVDGLLATVPQGPPGPPGPPGGFVLPGGRLTLLAALPEMPQSGPDISSTTLFYAPYKGGWAPVYTPSGWSLTEITSGPTDQVGRSLSCGAKWTANSQRDIFITSGGVLGSGPAWPGPSHADRGLSRYNGMLVNQSPMVLDISASESVTVPAAQATYLGSINIGAVAGTLTAATAYGQNRRVDVWNAYQQVPVTLFVGAKPPAGQLIIWPLGGTNCQYPNYVPFNMDTNNKAIVFTGLPTKVSMVYRQGGFINGQGLGAGIGYMSVIKWNNLSNGFAGLVGTQGIISTDTAGLTFSNKGDAAYTNPDAVGSNTAAMFIGGVTNYSGVTLFGGESRGLDKGAIEWYNTMPVEISAH